MFPFNASRRITSTIELIKSALLIDRLQPQRRGSKRSRQVVSSESLETRALLAVTPVVAINAPDDAFIGSNLNLTVSFDNAGSGNETGYGPIIDVVLPINGIDGGGSPDGLNTTGPATYLGTPITTIELTFPNGGGGTGSVNHPFFKDNAGNPLVVTGNTGDKLVVMQLPFGSFTPDQPAAAVNLPLTMSNLADLNAPLTIRTRSGFQFGTDPLDNPASDPSLVSDSPSNSSTWSVSKAVNPILTRLTKQNLAPESETATGPNFPRQYEIVVEIAQGQTITNFDVTDLLPPEIVYLGDGTLSVAPSLSPVIVSSPLTSGPQNAPNNNLTVRIPTVTGGAANTGFTMTFGYYVNQFNASATPVINATTADDTQTLNTAVAVGDWAPIDGRDAGGIDNAVARETVAGPDDILENKAIAVQKSVAIVTDSGGTGATPGDVLEYTLEFQVSDYFAFENIELNDLLSDGQRIDDSFTPRMFILEHGDTSAIAAFAGANFTIADNYTGLTDAGNAAGTGPSHVVDLGVAAGSQQARFRISNELISRGGGFADGQLVGGAIPNGGTGGPVPASAAPLPFGGTIGRILYRAIIQDDFSDDFPSGDESVDVGDTLTNSAVISGDVLSVANLLPNGNTEDDDTAASIDIARGSLLKQVYAINGNTSFASPIHVAPGDTVTYRLLFDLPTSDIEGLGFIDYLPLPVFGSPEVSGPFLPVVSAAVPAAGTAKFGPTDTFYANSVAVLGGLGLVPTIASDADANSLTFNYGDFDDPTNNSTQVDILFTVTVSDDPFADGLFLTNQVRQVETSTNAGDSFNDAIVQINLGEPVLNIQKGVVGSNSGGTFSPATIGPLAFTAPGAGDNNAATPEFAGTITSTNLAATPINSNLSGVDAGDVVKFAIVVENTGSSRLGAFDVALRDSMPAGFAVPASGLNLSITDGTGATLTFTDLGGGLFGSGFQLNDPGATVATGDGSNGGAVDAFHATSGRNIVIVTYDLELTNAVTPNSALVNTATLVSYAGAEGSANHIPGGLTETATVTVATPVVDKVITTTNQVHTAGNNVAIGEIVTYTVTVTVPEGQSAATQLVDTLDAGLGFVDIVSVTASSGALTSSVGTFAVVAAGSSFGSVGAGAVNAGRLMTVDFGTLTNSDTNNTTDETLTIVYRAVVLNTATNIRGAGRNNNAAWNWTGGSVVDAAPNVTIVEPTLDVVKTMNPASADAGDTVTITLVLQHAASSNADAFEVNLQDILPAGLNYVAASLMHTAGTAPTSGPTESGGTISASWTTFPLGTTSTFTLQATLTGAVIPGSVITNTATTDWTGLPAVVTATQSTHNTLAVERTGDISDPGGAANNYRDSGADTVTVTSPAPVKSIVATSEAHTANGTSTIADPTRVAIGEIVRYRLQTTLPEGTSPNLRLVDTLPNGLSLLDLSQIFVSFSADSDLTEAGDLSGADNDAVAPTFLLPGGRVGTAGQTLTFDLGSLVNNDSDVGTELITLEFNVLVTNAVTNQNAVQRSNSFIVQVNGSNVATSNSVVSQVVEPAITNVTKSVTSFSTGSVTYQVTYSNTGTATAFDVQMRDILPAPALTLNVASVTVTPAGGAVGVTDSSAANTVDVVLSTIPVGGSVTITYTASVNSATQSAAIPNTAAVTYTSLPGGGTVVNATGSSTPVNGERTGADGPGGPLNDYANNGSASLGALGDRVWFDVDADATQDGGEPGIGGVTMTLTWFGPNGALGGGDDVTVTHVTAADGSYQFVGLPAGNYRVVANTADLPAGMAQTFDASGSQSDSTSNRTLTGGQIATDQDFGYRGTGSIGDTVWYDIDSNGTQNGSEPGIPSVTVTLNIDFDRNGSTDVVLTRVTDQNGNYNFPNLPFADYTIVTTQPGGTDQTFDASGSQIDNTSALTLPAAANNAAQDFGYVGTGSIGDRVWYDQDSDGVQDAAEPGFAGVIVALDIDFNQDGTIDYTTTATTDINGNYLFPNLPVGSYYVRIPTAPSGTAQTFDADGTGTANRSTLVLGAGQNNLAQDFGFRGTGSIGDRVWFDADQDDTQDAGEPGFVGVPVALDIDLNGDSIIDMTLNTVTGANGAYLFSSLPAGTYAVRATQPTGTNQTFDASGSQIDNASTLVLAAGANNLVQDFGYVGTGSIGDTVFFDINGDGAMNGLDVGIPGVAVSLSADLNGDGLADYTASTTTNATGLYSFGSLPPGTYTISVTQPFGTTQTFDASGPLNNSSVHVLAAGENNVAQDFGYTGTGSIGDRVWFDADADDVQDGGEPGFVGATVALDIDLNGDGTNEVTLTTATGVNGAYSFSNLPAGTYAVRVTPPTGTSQTFDASGSQSDSTSNLILAAGANNTSQDFGYRGTGSIGDTVWFDIDSSGTQNGTEPGIPGVTVTLAVDLNGDSVTDYTTSQITNSSGGYLFADLPPGNYTISAAQPGGTTQTFDSDGTGTANQSLLALAAGANNLLQDFGYVGTGSIGDRVWYDQDSDGVQDAGEPGFAGVIVDLDIDFNQDGTVDYTTTTTTNLAGNYLFPNLPVGSYTVRIPTAPSGTTQTFDADGTATVNRSSLVLGAGQNNLAQDFGFTGTGSIGDRVWFDQDQDAAPTIGEPGFVGVPVALDIDLNGDTIIDMTLNTVTGANGAYLFSNLPAGTYAVRSTQPTGTNQSYDASGSDVDNTSNLILAAGENNLLQDFGYFGTGSIGDTVFFDINGDGIMNGQDVGIPDVTVHLDADLDGDGTTDYASNQITNSAGQYNFPALPPGSYTITVTQPSGTTQTYDGDLPLNNSSVHVLAAGENNIAQDFGYTGTGSIGDRVWFDADADGVQDAGEPGFVGVPVQLDVDLNGDGTFEVTLATTTAANGAYSFNNLPAGNYRVRIAAPPAGTSQTYDLDGTLNNQSIETLTAGENNTSHDFGYRGTGSIGDRVWFDANADGVQDGIETGIPGIVVTLNLDLDGDSVTDYTASQPTGATGGYLFSNLPPGAYTITAIQPFATVQTFDASGAQNDNQSTLILAAGQNNLVQDFGYDGVGTGTIGDTIWLDRNGDGVQDLTEPGLANVTVTLQLDVNGDSNPDYTEVTTTNASGQYLFTNLIPGDYTIIVTPPANMTQTADPDATLNNGSQVTLAAGVNNLTQDFGYRGPGVIGDFIYRDQNGNGSQDGGDTGIGLVTVNLSGDIDGDGLAETFSTQTNSSGGYSFTDLPVTTPTGAAILYTVSVDPASLPITVTPFVDPDGTADNRSTVTLTPASPINNTLDFGYVELVDLAITKTNTDPTNVRLPNELVTYRIVVTNSGPGPAVNAHVIDNFPAQIVSASWVATGSLGTVFSATGTGNMNDTVFIPVNGSITYTVTTTLNGTFLGNLTNTATVTTVQIDTDPTNNSSTNVTQISPIVVTSLTPPVAGQLTTFRARGLNLHTALVPFAISTTLGTSVVNGVTLGLANPTIIGIGVQCSGGTVEASYVLPASWAGRTVYVQAFETQPSKLASNVMPLAVGSSAPVIAATAPVTQNSRPTFTWSAAAGATSYDVWIGKLPATSSAYLRQTVSGTSFTPTSNMAIGRYTISVQGIRADGTRTAWSAPVITEIDTPVQLITTNGSSPSRQPTIAWNALPGAARYDIWVNNLTTGVAQVIRNTNVTTTSFTPSTLLNFGTYRIWVRGIDATGNAGAWSNLLQLTVTPAPTLSGPAAVTVDSTPTFDWTDVPGANRYDLWVNNLSTGANQVIRQTALTVSQFTPASTLPKGNYKWWVRAISTSASGPVTGSWSDAGLFTIGGVPTLLTPGSTTSDTTPSFTWTAVQGAASYQFWVDRIGIQNGIINQSGITVTTYTPATALPAGNYRVWMRAFGTDGTVGNWGTVGDFSIVATGTLQDEILLPEDELLSALKQLDEEILAVVSHNRRTSSAVDSRTEPPEVAEYVIEMELDEHSTPPVAILPSQPSASPASSASSPIDFESLDYLLSQMEGLEWNV